MVSLYIVPSILAIALKLTIFWFGRRSLMTASTWLWCFFIGLFIINIVELVCFFYVDKPAKAFWWLSTYHVFAGFSAFSLLALSLSNVGKLSKLIKYAMAIGFTISVIPLLIPGMAMEGVKSIGYSVTRIPGSYYFIVQLGLLIPLIASLTIAIYYSFRCSDYSSRRKSQILSFACAPLIVSAITIILIMQMGAQINAAVIISLMITVTLLILVFTEHKESAYKFMSFIPRTRENCFIKQLTSIVSQPTSNWKEGRQLIEQEMIREALLLTDGNKDHAADLLGISRQTLMRRLGNWS